jgi:hypothetical protein
MEDAQVNPMWLVLLCLGGVVLYAIVSNTLYFLLGARLLQFLPGVKLKGLRGTLRLGILLAITVVVSAWWLSKSAAQLITGRHRTRFSYELQRAIRLTAARLSI